MDWNLQTAARTLYQEAANDPGSQRAIASVLWNRKRSGKWGSSLASVCLARSQFSAWGPAAPSDKNMLANFRHSCALADDDPHLVALAKIITEAEYEPDPTGGAMWYANLDVVNPPWATTATNCGKWGRHTFFKDVH